MLLPVQAPLDTDRSRSTVVRRGTSPDALLAFPCPLDGRHIESKPAACAAQRFALSRHKEPMQLLCKGLKVLDGLGCGATLTQKLLELIHRVRVTGQEVATLQCLHGASPLE